MHERGLSMIAKLKLTKAQEEKLYLLRLDGLRREIKWHEAEAEYNKAVEIEKAVQQYVIDNNEYHADGVAGNPRITWGGHAWTMNEVVFINDYLPKVRAAYMELYGIDNPLNFVYSEPFRERASKAEKVNYMIAVDFLKISGATAEAESLEKAICSYLRPGLKEKLKSINESFIRGK